MNRRWSFTPKLLPIGVLALAGAALLLSGCSRNEGKNVASTLGPAVGTGSAQGTVAIQVHPGPPPALQTVSAEGHTLTLWPYTGASFEPDVDPIESKDPINVVFVGDVDPIKIRAALTALDGDRSAFGIPNIPPFNERWADAHGTAQTAYAEPGGWAGSVIQLRLGEYGPIRVHLRLFRTGAAFGEGSWTLGGVHFELMVPGTANHVVLSWKVARDILTADLVRSGLLVAPPSAVGPISETPSYRTIDPTIYNGLPIELVGLIGGPPQPVSAPVPIPSDGMAMVFHLEGTPAPTPGTFSQQFTIPFGQVIPKPLCSDGPYDYVYVEGPLDLSATATVDAQGRYTMSTRYSGRLTITPVDVTQSPPAPSGAPFTALVGEVQSGQTGGGFDMVLSRSRLLGPEKGGAELQVTDLKVSSGGVQEYRMQTQCLQP